jgi:hypothetical protein
MVMGRAVIGGNNRSKARLTASVRVARKSCRIKGWLGRELDLVDLPDMGLFVKTKDPFEASAFGDFVIALGISIVIVFRLTYYLGKCLER